MSSLRIDRRVLETPLGAGFKQWLEGWPAFQSKQKQWLASLQDANVLYALPPDFTEFLAQSQEVSYLNTGDVLSRTLRPLLSDEEAEAEQSFYHLCEQHQPGCIGVAYGSPIRYPLFTSPLPFPELSADDIIALKWADESESGQRARRVNRQFKEFEGPLCELRARLMAYAGWLVSNEAFRQERDGLRARWEALPEDVRTAGPFGLPAIRLNYLTEAQRAPYADLGDGYLSELEAFLAKWCLTEMTTWDLPNPQGPLLGMSAKTVEHFTGCTPVVDYYPPFYPVPSDQDLHKDLRDAQQRAAQELGIPDGFPPVGLTPRHTPEKGYELAEAGYATALRLYFAELAFLRRYGYRRGFKSRLESFTVTAWEVEPRRIRQLREMYAGAFA